MKRMIGVMMIAAVAALGAAAGAQEEIKGQQPLSSAQDQPAPSLKPLWVDEVIAVDLAKKQLEVRCFDFETDTDQTATLQVTDKTVFEGVASFADIEVGDPLSVDYTLSPQGVMLAETVIVEGKGSAEGELKADIPLDEVLADEAADTAKQDAPASGQ